ncbi:hypothetical protein [Streptomyces sp. NPDC004267]|uniref:hypothetical protein n=1 Tax=Streptomyces sp. NPDC004267 TaxID=3364694 RepID=UPI0036A858FA
MLCGGDEISAVFFLDGPDARNTLLLRDLPATDAMDPWTAPTPLRVLPTAFRWTAGLLTPRRQPGTPWRTGPPAAPPTPHGIGTALITAPTEDGRASYTDLARRIGTRRRSACNPLAAARYHDRHAVSRKKADPGDALVLAHILRTDMHAHRPLPDGSELARAIAGPGPGPAALWNRGDDRTRVAGARGLEAYAGASPMIRAAEKKSGSTRR